MVQLIPMQLAMTKMPFKRRNMQLIKDKVEAEKDMHCSKKQPLNAQRLTE